MIFITAVFTVRSEHRHDRPEICGRPGTGDSVAG
jgi:hypothetical protein